MDFALQVSLCSSSHISSWKEKCFRKICRDSLDIYFVFNIVI